MLTGNRGRGLCAISTGIHAMPNTHNGNTSNIITSENRTLNRSSPTPTRQQGRMNIHNTKRRHMQHVIRQNAAIRSHAENISLRSLKRLNNLRRHTIGLNDRQPQLKRLSLNRRRLQLLTTPTNSIRTSNNKRNLIPSLNKRNQRRHSKIRRTHKHNTHKGRLPSTKAETATKNSGKPSTRPIRKNNSTKTNIPKTKERAAINAALPTKQLSAKTPFPGPTAPGRVKQRQRSPRGARLYRPARSFAAQRECLSTGRYRRAPRERTNLLRLARSSAAGQGVLVLLDGLEPLHGLQSLKHGVTVQVIDLVL